MLKSYNVHVDLPVDLHDRSSIYMVHTLGLLRRTLLPVHVLVDI